MVTTSNDDLYFPINAEHRGQRLDLVLATLLPDCSRSYAAQLIRSGAMGVNHERRKPSYRLRLGDIICGHSPVREPDRYVPEPMPLDIIYEDAQVIVLNKPAGLVVHPAPGHASGTLVNGLLAHCPDLGLREAGHRPGIVHRLDKDTSGVMVVAKQRRAHEALAHQFKQRQVRKQYLAIVRGQPRTATGEVNLPIGRHPRDRKKMSITTRRGRTALTGWTLRTAFVGAALLVLELKTGRTHQARVHCAAMRHPILGDPVYGSRRPADAALPDQVKQALKNADRQMLHAWRLTFYHPALDREVTFEAAMPNDMRRVLKLLPRQ
jgi:23S rRNA pseudouridine1911/1915/1917 synthase